MPPVSIAQSRAMHAAATGNSTLGIPMSVGREFIGDGPPKKRLPAKAPSAPKTHRGRKPSTKPGASHLGMLQQAHAAGDFKAAKTHALNYAKAVHAGATMPDDSATDGMSEPDTDDMPSSVMTGVPPAPSKPAGPSRAMLAKLAMRPRKS